MVQECVINPYMLQKSAWGRQVCPEIPSKVYARYHRWARKKYLCLLGGNGCAPRRAVVCRSLV